MKPIDLSRLHAVRMNHDATKYRMDEMRPRFEALRTRHEDGTAPRAVVAYQLFQTPETLAERMADIAGITSAHAVLEPSAGLGRILRRITARKPARVTACEIAPDCARELYGEFPDVDIKQGDFLQRQLGTFDRIVMNPPFHMRSDIKHTLHALQCHLAPGGLLVGLCMSGPKREEILRPLADLWEIIPAGTFRAEGTGVETVLFTIRK